LPDQGVTFLQQCQSGFVKIQFILTGSGEKCGKNFKKNARKQFSCLRAKKLLTFYFEVVCFVTYNNS